MSINLFPDRKQRQIKKNNMLFLGWGFVLVAVLFFLSMGSLLLNNENHNLEKKVKNSENALKQIERKNAKEGRQLNLLKAEIAFNKAALSVLDVQIKNFMLLKSLASVLPQGVYLSRVEKETSKWKLEGEGSSSNKILNFLKALRKEKKFNSISLDSIDRHREKFSHLNFVFRAQQ